MRHDGQRPQAAPPRTGRAAARARRYLSALQGLCERVLAKDALWAALVVVVLAPILSQQECGLPSPDYRLGEVTQATIKAPYDIELPDEKATYERREAERLRVPPVYDLVVTLPAEQADRIADLFESGRAALKSLGLSGPRGRASAANAGAETIARVKASLKGPVPEAALPPLIARGFSRETEEAASRALMGVMQGKIVGNKEGLPDSGGIVVREVGSDTTVESEFTSLEQIRDLNEARAAARDRLGQELRDMSGAERAALASLLDAYVVSNLSYSAGETESRRALAMASVPRVFTRIPRGRVIIREGEVFTQEAIDILSRLQGAAAVAFDTRALAGNAIILSLLVLFLHRYVTAHQRVFRRVKNLYSMVLIVAFLVTLGSWVGVFIADAVADRVLTAPFNDPAGYYWALPVSAGAMLVTLLANARVATVCSAFIALLFGMVLDWSAQAMVFALISCFAAIYGMVKYERRTAILKACALVGAVNAVVVFALGIMEQGFTPAGDALFRMAMAAVGGILAAPVVSFTLPILEWLYNVLTDIRLLELSNLDNPLLRRLSLEAPGTYNHSIIVGTLAEQAAEEIGAHALLCRVAAYYHDIGKISKPEYFVENMRDGLNRHDRLSPRMSSLVIANHVKEGLRLAEEYNLPRQIRDIIPQHHGTRLITYFYRKAKRKADPQVPEIAESDYRYPGPKPQTKEAAIFMMADSVEAAARTVEEPTPASFEEVVSTVCNAIVLDGQLDECDLTFSDLGRIRGSFLRTLAAVHHHRIAYPGFNFDRSGPRAVEAE